MAIQMIGYLLNYKWTSHIPTLPFEFRLEDEKYEFHFSNKDYAKKFADINGVTIDKFNV